MMWRKHEGIALRRAKKWFAASAKNLPLIGRRDENGV
jgi:hypothetical protein